MIHPAPGSPSPHVWISEPRARHLHAACGSTGRLFAVASLVLATAIVLLGLRLPTAYHVVNSMAWSLGGVSMLTVFFSALGLAGVRSYLQGGYLDLRGATRSRRLSTAVWAMAIVLSFLACFLLLVTVSGEADDPYHPEVRFTVGVWAYLGLLASPPVLAGVLFFVGRRLLGPAAIAATRTYPQSGASLPPPPSRYAWISARRAQEVRVASGRLGAALISCCILLIPLLVLCGSLLPPVYPALGFASWVFTATGMVQVLLASVVLIRARRHLSGEHLDLEGARTTRSGLGASWGWTLFTTTFACLGLLLGVSNAARETAGRVAPYPGEVWTVLVLLGMPAVLTGAALFAGRRLFAPPVPAR